MEVEVDVCGWRGGEQKGYWSSWKTVGLSVVAWVYTWEVAHEKVKLTGCFVPARKWGIVSVDR